MAWEVAGQDRSPTAPSERPYSQRGCKPTCSHTGSSGALSCPSACILGLSPRNLLPAFSGHTATHAISLSSPLTSAIGKDPSTHSFDRGRLCSILCVRPFPRPVLLLSSRRVGIAVCQRIASIWSSPWHRGDTQQIRICCLTKCLLHSSCGRPGTSLGSRTIRKGGTGHAAHAPLGIWHRMQLFTPSPAPKGPLTPSPSSGLPFPHLS